MTNPFRSIEPESFSTESRLISLRVFLKEPTCQAVIPEILIGAGNRPLFDQRQTVGDEMLNSFFTTGSLTSAESGSVSN